MEQIFNSLEQIFEHAKHNSVELTYIKTNDDLLKLIEIHDSANDKLSIVTKEFSILITDNRLFNNTYLLDLFLLEFCKFDTLKNKIKLFYLDSLELRIKLSDAPMLPSLDELTIDKYERTILRPSIFIIHPIDNEIYLIDEPSLAGLSISNIVKEKIHSILVELDKELE